MEYGHEMLKGSTDALLLSLISRQPMYGYQIIKELERRSGGGFKLKEGTLYPALHRLEKARLLQGKWERLPRGQERRYYRITAEGQRALVDKIAEWQGFSAAVNLIIQPSGI